MNHFKKGTSKFFIFNIEEQDKSSRYRATATLRRPQIYRYEGTRIEPVGKPYREVCLRSELWPWMAHQLNSWSKHPGTRIEQVLAYCRDEQKYVGYWAIILSHCDHEFWRTDLKIHRADGRDTAYIPAKFHRIFFKNKREISVQHIFQVCLLVTLTFKLHPWNLHQVVSLSRTVNQLNLKTMG